MDVTLSSADGLSFEDLMYFDARWTFLEDGTQIGKLLAFERAMLHEDAGGAWLGCYDESDSPSFSWYDGDAVDRLQAIAARLAAATDYADRHACRHTLVFTPERLAAAARRAGLESDQPGASALASYLPSTTSIPRRTYIALHPDFARYARSEILYPLITITAGWPARHKAPPPSSAPGVESPTFSMDEARTHLHDTFTDIANLVARLLTSAGVGIADLSLDGRNILPPSVWVARPGDSSSVPTAGDYLDASWRNATTRLAGASLGTRFLDDTELDGSCLYRPDAALLVFRTEDFRSSQNLGFTRYFVVPHGETSPHALHGAIWQLADRIGFVEFVNTRHFLWLSRLLEGYEEQVTRWRRGAAGAHQLVDPMLLRLPVSRRRWLDMLHEGLSLVYTTLLQGLGNISEHRATVSGLAHEVVGEAGELREDFDRFFREAEVPGLSPVGDSIVKGIWYNAGIDRIERLTHDLEVTERDYSRVLDVLSKVFEQRRVKEIESLEGMSHQINLVLAGLTAALGFSALVNLEVEDVAVPVLWALRVLLGSVALLALLFIAYMLSYLVRRRSSGPSPHYRAAQRHLTAALEDRSGGANGWSDEAGREFCDFLRRYADLCGRAGERDGASPGLFGKLAGLLTREGASVRSLMRSVEQWSLKTLALTERREVFEVFSEADVRSFFEACEAGDRQRRDELLTSLCEAAGT